MSVVVSVVGSKTTVKNGCTSRNDGVVKQTCATAAPMAHAAFAPTVQSVVGAPPQVPRPRQVIVSPLSTQPTTMIDRVLLKAVNKFEKKDTKMFTLRSILIVHVFLHVMS